MNFPTKHPQVHIEWGDQAAEVDEGIAPLILELWKAGIDTMMSCQDNDGRLWIEFPDTADAARFLDVVADYDEDVESIYNRATGEWEPDDWEAFRAERAWHYSTSPIDYGVDQIAFGDDQAFADLGHRDFGFTLSVRFPLSDYPTVAARLEAWNAASGGP